MSAQSIKEIDIFETLDSIDEFLVCEGNSFRNIIDYDLKMKVDYDRLRYVLYLKGMLDRKKCSEEIIQIINKIVN